MNEDRQTILKEYHDNHNFYKLLYTKSKIPENYFNEKNLNTRDIVHSKIEKIINCSNINMQSQDVNLGTGEISPFSLYNSLCGVYVVCPVCSRVRAEIIWSKYKDKVNVMHKKYRYAYSVTFTLKNMSKFQDMYYLMNNSLSRFFKQGQKRGVYGLRSGGESSKIKAAIGSIEVKSGKNSELAHVHLHMLCFTDRKLNYIVYDQEKKAVLKKVYGKKRIPKYKLDNIARQFMDCKGNIVGEDYEGEKIATSKIMREWCIASLGSVNIECKKLDDNANIKKALIEVVKYPIKTNYMNGDLFTEVLLNRDNKRFLRIYGNMINSKNNNDFESLPVEQEEKEILSHSVDVRVYNRDKKRFVNGEEEQYELAHKLNKSREELKKYFSCCSRSRTFERSLLDPIKMSIALQKQTPELLKENINTRNAIYNAWKHFLKKAYREILKIKKNVKSYRRGNRKLSKLEKYYFQMFVKNVPMLQV